MSYWTDHDRCQTIRFILPGTICLRLTLQTRGQQQLHAKDEVGRRVGFGWAAQILIAIEDAVVQLKY